MPQDGLQTIASQLPQLRGGSSNSLAGANSSSAPDLDYSLVKARMLLSCYRRDEANNPEIYVMAIASILSEYPKEIVDLVTDPRSGIAGRQKFLPAAAEIKEECEEAAFKLERLRRPARKLTTTCPYCGKPK